MSNKMDLTGKGLKRIFFKIILPFFFFLLLLVLFCNIWVVKSTEEKVYSSVAEIPSNDVALVLGTSKYSRTGRSNLFFKSRIEAAVKLYKAGKVKHLLLSGDNSLSYYNEPKDMKKALMAMGVPDSVITLDYAGFSTFDSMVRSKRVFKQSKLTIITQEFHSYRALFISKFYGIDATAFVTEPIPTAYSSLTLAREYFARCKAIIDLYVLRKEPKFLGKEINIMIE